MMKTLKTYNQILLEKKKDKTRPRSLVSMIYDRDEQAIDEYIKSGKSLNIKNKRKETPLYVAIYLKNFQLAKTLINAGANINLQNEYGQTPLWLAMKNNTLLSLDIIKTGKVKLNDKINGAQTYLELAITLKKTQIAITLIEYGAKVSYIDLERAFIKDLHQRLIGLMIDKLDNKKDLNIIDEDDGGNFLYYCVLPKYINTVIKMIKHGIDYTLKNDDGFEFLDVVSNEYKQTLRKKIDLELKNDDNENLRKFKLYIDKKEKIEDFNL